MQTFYLTTEARPAYVVKMGKLHPPSLTLVSLKCMVISSSCTTNNGRLAEWADVEIPLSFLGFYNSTIFAECQFI